VSEKTKKLRMHCRLSCPRRTSSREVWRSCGNYTFRGRVGTAEWGARSRRRSGDFVDAFLLIKRGRLTRFFQPPFSLYHHRFTNLYRPSPTTSTSHPYFPMPPSQSSMKQRATSAEKNSRVQTVVLRCRRSPTCERSLVLRFSTHPRPLLWMRTGTPGRTLISRGRFHFISVFSMLLGRCGAS
jgi:hypothetical protein